MTKLFAGRFSYSNTFSALLEQFPDMVNAGFRFNPEFGGLIRGELTVKAKSKFDIYDRRTNHPGQRIAFYSSWIHRPISGYIATVEESGANTVTYIIKGPSWRLEAELDTTAYATGTTISSAIQTILTDHAPHISSDYTNILTNATTLGGWQPKTPQGTRAIDAIKELVNKSDSSNNRYFFYLLDEPFNGTSLGQYVAYYNKVDPNAAINWQVNRKDLRSIRPSTSITGRVTNADVYYGTVIFTASGGSTTTATSATNLITLGLKPGDRFSNITNGENATIVTVTAGTLTHDGTASATVNTNSCAVRLESPKSVASASTTPSTLWDVNVADFFPDQTAATAAQFAATLIEDDPITDQPIVIGAPWILDENGARWPLWEPIIQGGGYLRVNDLYPAAALFSNSADKLTSFIGTAWDYDHASRTLRVQLGEPDSRLDVRLRRARIIESEQINRPPV